LSYVISAFVSGRPGLPRLGPGLDNVWLAAPGERCGAEYPLYPFLVLALFGVIGHGKTVE
jgi:hypothetical protein